MAAVNAAMVWGVLVSARFVSISADQTNITAEPGQTLLLPCTTADNKPPVAVQWRRPSLGKQYVLLFRDNRIDVENQHPSYENRVDLMDRQMMDGNVSLILKNVTTNDTGSYECGAQYKGSRETKPITTIQLNVLSPGNKDGESKFEENNRSVGITVVWSYWLFLLQLVFYF